MDTPTLTTLSVLQAPSMAANTFATTQRFDKTKVVQKTRRASGKSRIVYDFSVETLMQFAHLRQDDAAKALGVAPITLKRICHRRQMRWPYRARRCQARREETAAQVMMAMKSVEEDHDEELPADTLPSYCVYTVPVDVPAIQVEAETLSPLPSLKETLGYRMLPCRAPAESTSSERLDWVIDQPLATKTPPFGWLPRLNVRHPAHIFQSPPQGKELRKKATTEPPVSPAMLRLHAKD